MKMKMNSLKAVAAIGLSALAIGSAAAQDAASKPVGYETIDYGAGFTPLGIRLHQAPVTSGVVASADASSITVTGADFDTLLTAGTDYVLEIENAKGIIQVVNSWAGEAITTPADLSAEIVAGTTTFTIRPVDTLESVFGSDALSFSIAQGAAGGFAAADQVWIADGAGGYDKYYFDTLVPPAYSSSSWAKIGSDGASVTAVDGSNVNLIYADGIVMSSGAGGSFVVTGSVKLTPTELRLLNGFTFVSSVAPAGASLETAFPLGAGLASGAAGGFAAADQIWIQNSEGAYDKFYYDTLVPPTYSSASWAQIDAAGVAVSSVDGASINLPAGYVISSQGGGNVTQGVPSFYSTL